MGVETILRASRLTATPAMTDDNQLSFNLPSVSRKKVRAAFDGGRLSSDSGVMLLALADRRRAVADTLAALIADHRDPSHITHTVADILRARMLAIGCGYPDGNDFDRLRFDPAFKLACGRLPDTGGDLCSQPTISRWENAPTLREIIRLTYTLVDIWCRSYQKPPRFVVLDIDDTVDVVHGHQQLAQWNAHYDERCFLPIHVYDAATGAPVTVILRPGKTPSGVEVRKLLSRLIGRIRRHWPSTHITPRASPDLKIKNSDKILCEYQLRERSVNKYLRWHDQITRSRGPKRNVTLSATRLSLDSSSLIDTSSLKDHLYVPQPTPKPTRWQPKGSSIFERTGWAR